MRMHVLLATCLLAACASAPGAKSPTGNGQTLVVNKTLLARGYFAERSGSDVRYCRQIVQTGSIVPRKNCLSEVQAISEVEKSDHAIERIRRSNTPTCDVRCLN